ncbi:protein INSYN2B isoform X2 [Pelobates fuscus]|uniref:protein INSYN2B isoform X2 n=1 Tax=Pelobates fuscus TaxID=191477 RepID=UPI002FE45A82
MGRNETSCLRNISCDSMEQQTMKVRPALLKRKNQDSSELLNHSNHRRNKSQQVRFKEDTTNTNPPGFAELDLKSGENTQLINGKSEKCHSRSMCSFPYSKSQKGLQTVAVQTSPRLRKNLPILKEKNPTATKHLNKSPRGSSCVQFNGDLSDEDMAIKLSHLRTGDTLEGFIGARKYCSFKQVISKAQSNGPINECSGMEFDETFQRVTVSTQVPENSMESISEEYEESNVNLETEQTLQDSSGCPDRYNSQCTQSSISHVCFTKHREQKTEEHIDRLNKNIVEKFKENIDSKKIINVTPSLSSNLSYCFHSEHQSHKVSEGTPTTRSSQISRTFEKKDKLQDATTKTRTEKNPTQPNTAQCSRGVEQSNFFPKIETHYNTYDETKEGNPGHTTQGELCSLQGKLKSIEESLQSNQEKIKILLNVIQDLEKARAFSEGRNFYRTGQDLNNCSTCQSTACIIYRI